MATIVNNPTPTSESGNGMALMIGMLLLLLFGFLFFVYGVPMMRQSSSAPSVTIPDRIDGTLDVNVNQPSN